MLISARGVRLIVSHLAILLDAVIRHNGMLIDDVPQLLRAVAPVRGNVDGAVLRVGLTDEHDALLRLDSTTQLAQAVA